MAMARAQTSLETYSYKCAEGLEALLVEYLLMQNRYLTIADMVPKTKKQFKELNGSMPLLTDLCLAMRSDPLGVVRRLGEVVTCVCGSSVTYTFSETLITAYRLSVIHVSLIGILDGTALN